MSEQRIAQRARKEAEKARRAIIRYEKSIERARSNALQMERYAIETEQKMRTDQITEDGGMRNDDEPAQTVPPHVGWKLVVRRRFTAANAIYDCGTIVDPAALGRNFRYFLSNHFCEWQPPSASSRKGPRELPMPEPPPPRPPIEVFSSDDPVEAWKRTLETHAEKVGHRDLARDLLLQDKTVSEIYGRAVRSWSEREHRFRAPTSAEL